MYAAYNIILNQTDKDLLMVHSLINENKRKTSIDYKKIVFNNFLKKSKKAYDGEKIKEEWFPNLEPDIFISYSHNDEDLANNLALYLENTFGLNVFVDSHIWKSADKLQKFLDDKYSIIEDNSDLYFYNKTQFTSSHVHAMLSIAIMEIIDKSKLVFFLQTENSVPIIEGVVNKTLSPWIYLEWICAKLLRKKFPNEMLLESIGVKTASKNQLQIAYPLVNNEIIDLSYKDILNWNNICENNNFNNDEKIAVLLGLFKQNK